MARAPFIIASVLIIGVSGCASKTGGTSSELNIVPCKLASEPPIELGTDGWKHIEVGAVVQWHIVDIWTGKNYDEKITSWKLEGAYPSLGTITSTGLYTAPDTPTTPQGAVIRVTASGGDIHIASYVANESFAIDPKNTTQRISVTFADPAYDVPLVHAR
jgi:hypothetical protein